ncbi:MAG TPA: RNA polymerase sigma factor [Polyangiaceae bacterium]|nr:RNA polymerase sigma factor [Polyangiaceae bacterium]
MAVDAGLPPNARRLAHPAVRAKTFDVIGKRVPSADADDIAQSAFVRLMMMPSLPEADDDLRALVVTVARGLLIDHHRKRKVREDRRDDAADVDEIAFEADDASAQMRERWRQALEFIEREVAAERVPAEILRWAKRLAAGDTYAQIAADEALPESTVKTRMRRAREHLRKRWPLYVSAAGGVAIFVLVIRPQEPVTVGRGRPESEPPSATAPPQSTGAQDYRQRAARECGAGEFDRCERELDEAKKLDPAGETLPEVKTMRLGIERAKAAIDDAGRR